MGIFKQLLVIAVLGGLVYGAWKVGLPEEDVPADTASTGGSGDMRGAAVVIVPVAFAPEQVRLEAVGTARAVRSALLRPEAAGEVTDIRFAADDYVEEGAVLLTLRQETERLDVELARVQLEDAERSFERLERLSASGTTTQVALDEARTALRTARLNLDRAQVALADRTLRAPFSGHIGLSEVEVGSRVDSSTEIATLDDRSLLLVRFDVPEALLNRLSTGLAVSIENWTGEQSSDGIVTDVDSRIDPNSRTFPVRAEIPNTDDRLRPGMSFRVTLDLFGDRRPAVPEIALQWGGDGPFVWTVRNGVAERVLVSILQRQADRVLIDAALEEGEHVVVEGLHRLRQGRPVDARMRDGAGPAVTAEGVAG
ncbi:MAG: efflux RND transporter periplasmic adaptor subunit [Alphaproteobacteria bacterium]